MLSSVCAAKAGPRSHPLSESQEVPVRINIAFYTSKELLMGGQRQEAEQEEVAAGPQHSALHTYVLRATSISLKGGGGQT